VKRTAIAYRRRDGTLFVRPVNVMAHGGLRDASPIHKLEADAPGERIGSAVRGALEASHMVDGFPGQLDPSDADLFSMADVKSWMEFNRRTRCVFIELDGNVVTIKPFLKIQGGFQSADEPWPREELSTDERLGELVREGLNRATAQLARAAR
jgi:hypothetical protein